MITFRSVALLLALSVVFGCGESATNAGRAGNNAAANNPNGKSDALNSSANRQYDNIFWNGDDRPFADMFNATAGVDMVPVRGRLVEEDQDDVDATDIKPTHLLSEDEMKRQDVEVTIVIDGTARFLGFLRTDDEGYLDAELDASNLELTPGRYVVEVRVEGKIAGTFNAMLLAADREVPVVRSDVDLTYLNTDFHSAGAILGLMREDAADKEALPAMPLVYRALRGDESIPVTFLSGSPLFFKRTLEQKMTLDQVEQDGLVLKPMKNIASTNVLGLDLNDIVPELKEQIGYKLLWLLKLRQQLPPTTPEILMGDDSEADFVIYNIYHHLLSGKLAPADLPATLANLEVAQEWVEQIMAQTKMMDLAALPTPLAIYINQTGAPGDTFDIADWMVEDVMLHHQGALPLMQDLQVRGWVSSEDVQAIENALGQ